MQVNVGIGTLAGSTIMLLTVAWGGSLIAGRCDLDEKVCPLACCLAGLDTLQMSCLCNAVCTSFRRQNQSLELSRRPRPVITSAMKWLLG